MEVAGWSFAGSAIVGGDGVPCVVSVFGMGMEIGVVVGGCLVKGVAVEILIGMAIGADVGLEGPN